MQYIVKHFSELTIEELLEIYKLRVSVFVVEQKCPYQEVDDADRNSYHIWFQDEDGIQAYARCDICRTVHWQNHCKKTAVRTGQQNRFQWYTACTGAVSCETNQDCRPDLCHSIL